jgi:hypothetical protein
MLACGVFLVSGGSLGQEKKKDDKKDPPSKVKGMLPQYWGKLGLSDEQKQNVYRIQGKYNEEIDKLEAKIKDLKAARDKEARAVLTADQRKRLEEILLGKDR